MDARTGLCVRVSRNGNSRTLSIPATVVDGEHIALGELFAVEVRSDGLFYRRVATQPHWHLMNEGRDQHVVVDPTGIIMVGEDPSPRPSLDWDY